MLLYTFYPWTLDGSSEVFEAHELRSDAEAAAMAVKVLSAHAHCTHVAVWEGDRAVLIHPLPER